MSGWGRWWEDAACLGLPVVLFLPDDDDSDTTSARAVCADCPVKTPCLNEAIRCGDVGIRAGLDQHERRRILVRGTRLPKGELYHRLEAAMDFPGIWILVAEFRAEHTAATYASQLKTRARPVPPGDWDFEGRPDGCGRSELWVRSGSLVESDRGEQQIRA